MECLEDRTLPSASPLNLAVPLEFNASNVAEVTHFFASPSEIDLYRVALHAGDKVDASVAAQKNGSGLASLLRIFDAQGTSLALDDREGGDPHLNFQAATAGDYLVGVSSAPNDSYDPTVAVSAASGSTTGLYTLNLRLTNAAILQPDVTGSSFRAGVDMAAAGDTIPVNFIVENRGGVDPGNFQVQLLLAGNDRFDSSAQVLATFQRMDLLTDATGRNFRSPAGFSVTLPSGLVPGPAFLGLRIVPDPTVPEAGLSDKSGVHRGSDFEMLTVVTRVPMGVTNLSQVDAHLNTETTGTLLGPDQSDTYSFTVSNRLGEGRLIADVGAVSSTLQPRLTLSGPMGELLIQSDSGRLDQYLQPGPYSLSVSARTGQGAYRLTTAFAAARPPLAPLAVGTLPRSVAVSDFNGDGIPDVVVPNLLDGTVSVLLGNGDGLFQPQRTFATGPRPISLSVADVNGDGRPDLLTPSKTDNTVSVLLGNGDGTFQPHTSFAVGDRPGGVAAADLNGDGILDLAVSNFGSAAVSVLLGNGDGTFKPQHAFNTGSSPGKVVIADVDGDGIPDLITPNYDDGNVSVLLGNGDGTFKPQRTFDAGTTPYSLIVSDLNGDGRPDIAVTNYKNNEVSVLLGVGDGSFQPRQAFAAGKGVYSIAAADVNGDGRVDLFTANFSDNSISVLLGKGDGTFSAAQRFAAGKGAGGIALADLNGDGRPDIVTANFTDNSVSVLLGRGDGSFTIQQSTPSPAPDLRVYSVATADLNGDGRPDIVTANKNDSNVSVVLRNRDGSFQTRQTFPTGPSPSAAVVADVNGDGVPDIVTSSYTEKSASVLLGTGDGIFAPPRNLPVGSTTYNLAVSDVNGDGHPDIITANNDGTVSVLLGNGDGTFQNQQSFAAGRGVTSVTVGDVNGDDIPDLATANSTDNTVSLLLGNGDGTFKSPINLSVGSRPDWVILEDVNGDGKTDVIATNGGDNTVSVLLGSGDGTFGAQQAFAAGVLPGSSVIGDFNGDGVRDLITVNVRNGDGNLLIGNGDGTFRAPQVFPIGIDGAALAVADFNADGRSDLVTANFRGDSVTIVQGNGDGTFRPWKILGVGSNRYAVAVADINGDGKPDLVKTNLRQNSVTVELGTGTGSFEPGQTLSVGPQPMAVRVADLNGDGRLDLAITNAGGDSVSVVLGNGDGTFSVQRTFTVGRNPRDLAIADFNGDGIPDLATANYNDGTVSVLLGVGDGSFGTQRTFAAGRRPSSLTVADVNGDGYLDLLTANSADDTVSVLLGNGNGTFQNQQAFATGKQPLALTVADVNGDHLPDVMTANGFDDTLSVLLGRGDGTFLAPSALAVGKLPSSITALDVNGDGKTDLVTANFGDNSASVLLGNGDGSFQNQQTHTTNLLSTLTVAADINGDGRPDLVTVGNHDNTSGVLLNKGGGEFRSATAAADVGLRNTPFLADVDDNWIADSIVLDRSGNILFRAGLPGSNNAFAPPVILNPGRPARDIALVHTGNGLAIAAADAHFDPSLSTNHFVFAISLYSVSRNGVVSRSTAFSTTALPSRLTAADLTGNGRDDLVVASALDNSVAIALQAAPGIFATPIALPAGVAPSDIAVADVNGDGLPDVVVSDQASGDVNVLMNDAAHTFSKSLRFRAGTELNNFDTSSGNPAISSLAQSVSLVAGDFTKNGHTDLVVVNAGVHSFSVLRGDGQGFTDPPLALTTSTSDDFNINNQPGVVVTGDFNRDGRLDLAVLMKDTGKVWIYTGNGDGTFSHSFSIPVGDQATGLSAVPSSGGGLLDLLVGNGFGDVLHLQGKGDGTFQISGNRVSLSVVPNLLGQGQAGVLVGNQHNNTVTLQAPTSGGSQFAPVQTLGSGGSGTQLAPGDVHWAVLDHGSTLPDAIVVSSGSNAVAVYRTTAVSNGVVSFAPIPQTLFVGTAPASVTVADVNADGVPDFLLANQGSNDVSVVFGSFDASGHWVGTPGPRLKSGGDGPIAVSALDLTGDGIPDLVVTNGGSGTITMLPGVGQGFFDDQRPRTLFDLGAAVVQTPTYVGTTGVGYAVTADGQLLRFDLGNLIGGATVAFSSRDVLAAQALATGQVVVAIADGTVDVLTPQGNSLTVTTELRAQGGVPALPSSLQVLTSAGGKLQVLVSSQGSDNVFVFAPALAATNPGSGGNVPPSEGGGSVIIASSSGGSAPSVASTNAVNVSVGAGESAASASSFASASLSATTGLAFSGSASSIYTVGLASSSTVLVAVQGNTYSTVALLQFGSLNDDDDGNRRDRTSVV